MLARPLAGAVFVAALAFNPGSSGGLAWAEPPAPSAAPAEPSAAPPAPSAAPPAPSAAAPAPAAAAAKGAIVVAIGDNAGLAARALAHQVYRDPALRPSIDEFTAKLLTGDAAAVAAAKGKLKEIGEIRAAIASASSTAAARRLQASLGVELGAAIVVLVTLDEGRPLARALRTASAAYEGAPLAGLVETGVDGATSFQWPGAATTLAALFPAALPIKPSVAPTAAPIVPAKKPLKDSTKEDKPFWASPWFWGTVGGVAAVGITIFVISKTTSSVGTVHIDGTVGP